MLHYYGRAWVPEDSAAVGLPLTPGASAADAAFAGQVGLVRQILSLDQSLATAVSANGGGLAQSSSA